MCGTRRAGLSRTLSKKNMLSSCGLSVISRPHQLLTLSGHTWAAESHLSHGHTPFKEICIWQLSRKEGIEKPSHLGSKQAIQTSSVSPRALHGAGEGFIRSILQFDFFLCPTLSPAFIHRLIPNKQHVSKIYFIIYFWRIYSMTEW